VSSQPVAVIASPPAPPSPAAGRPPTAEIAALVARGDAFLKAADIASARLYYERAADAGDGSAALKLGATFDPGSLSSSGVRGTLGDPARAASWYARALDLGEASAAQRLKNLDHTAR
jgi:TPR repeat protein